MGNLCKKKSQILPDNESLSLYILEEPILSNSFQQGLLHRENGTPVRKLSIHVKPRSKSYS